MTLFAQFMINGVILGLLYGLAALGFALVYNPTRIFHMAAAALYVAAAYLFYAAHVRCGMPLWAAGALAAVGAAGLSVLVEWAVYRPFYRRRASLNVVMIASIGVMTVLINVIALIFGNETKVLDNRIRPVFRAWGLIVTHPQMMQAVVAIALMILFFVFLRYSSFGLKARTLSNDATLFAALGGDVFSTRILVFALSGVFLAAGSCLTAYDVGMNPHVGMSVLINAMVAMIIGGAGRFGGCVLGGLLLGVLQALVVYKFSANWQNAIAFLVLLLFLFFRPQGIIGYRKRTV